MSSRKALTGLNSAARRIAMGPQAKVNDMAEQTTQVGGCCGSECCGGERAVSASTAPVNITDAVRERYAKVADEVLRGAQGGCGCASAGADTISERLYASEQVEGLPLKAVLASLGCGNPTALAELRAGETVLDLGSGGGIDVLLSARRVGPTGFAYGLDMTDSMLELARKNAAEAGATNVAFLKGDIAAIPLPENSVDVIISNCVINLAADKSPVLREAFRALKPGGRFAVSDIVIHGGLPAEMVDSDEMRRDLSSWAGCIAGAMTDGEYRELLAQAGFVAVDLEISRRYTLADLGGSLPAWASRVGETRASEIVGRFASTFVRATKPVTGLAV